MFLFSFPTIFRVTGLGSGARRVPPYTANRRDRDAYPRQQLRTPPSGPTPAAASTLFPSQPPVLPLADPNNVFPALILSVSRLRWLLGD
jgi:hypothetical protein